MSLKFNWRFFDVADLQARVKEAVTESISQTRRPPVIAAPIRAVDVNLGTEPPDLAFQEIPAVSLQRTHIIFHFRYSGDASLTLDTAIEANPLREPLLETQFPQFVKPRLIAALDRLVLPFRLKIQHIVVDTLVDVVYTPHGVVVNFRGDPVKQIKVESSLDMLPGVNAMINFELQHQLTMSFYEDIPETIWTSTSPTKTPPDPFFGARRWSQHLKTFTKFLTTFWTVIGPSVARPTVFNTLSLAASVPELSQPVTILSRGCLRSLEAHREKAPIDHIDQFLTEGSVYSGTSTSSVTRKPKRRVISLRGIMEKELKSREGKEQDKNSASPEGTSASATESDFSEDAEKNMYSQDTPRRPMSEKIPNLRFLTTPVSSRHVNGTYSNPQSTPQTPEMQSTESAVLENLDTVSPLPPLPAQWDHRRYSTPTNSRMRNGHQLNLPKSRSTSIQPSQLKNSPILNAVGRRIPSTNDLRNAAKPQETASEASA